LVLVFVVVDCLADPHKEEEDDGDDEVERIEICIQREDAKIIEIPKEMEDDHEEDGESSENIQFDESLRFSFFFLMSFVHGCSFSLFFSYLMISCFVLTFNTEGI
jgi:hypothetical protein